MSVQITQINLGFDQCYVLKSEGVIAIDAGAPNTAERFARGLEAASIDPRDVRLLVLTHGHWDHIGSAKEIREMTGAQLSIHHRDAPMLEQSARALPQGVTRWGRVLGGLHRVFLPLIRIPPAKVDILIGDEGLSLAEYGIPGRILYTPGHTEGSVSVLLDTGQAFVGDLAMNRLPLRLSPGLPIFAVNPEAVVGSWKRLLDAGATTVYPAHGKPFPAEIIRNAIERHEG